MDTVFLYRLIDAVRDSLDRCGREPYVLQRIVRHDQWLDFALLQDYLDQVGCDELPLHWEGRPLPAHDSIKLIKRTDALRRIERTGAIFLREDALLAPVIALTSHGVEDNVLIAGERRPGALKRLLDDYQAFARAHSRTNPWITVIGDDNLPRPRGLDWDSLVLNPGFRDDLRGQVDAFFALRDEYVHMGVSHRRGMLFTGPPGNGKTSALRVIASVRDEPFILHKVKNHTDQSELDDAFNRATREAPSILCFEDVDSLFDGGLLSHFLNRIDGLYPLEGVLILATTNHPEKLDGAITERPSRFDRLFHFGNPAAPERRRFLKAGLGSVFDEDLVVQTDGFSMAQVKEVRVSACLEAIHAGLPGPTKEGALRSIERLRGQRAIVQSGGNPEQTIGFHWSRGATTQTAEGRSDVE
jgi:hypothetical protein